MAEVVNQNKRYLRFAEDFINSHKFHDAKDARSKNEHEKNLGIIKALLFGNRKIVEKYFPLKNHRQCPKYCVNEKTGFRYFFLYLDSVFKYKNKLVHNQPPIMNWLCPFLLNFHQ